MNNNKDISNLMSLLSKMNKKDLEKGLSQLTSILNSKDKNQILDDLKNNLKNN